MIKIDAAHVEELGRQLGMELEKVAKRAVLATALRVIQRATTAVIPAEPRPPVDRRIYEAGFHARPANDGAIIENNSPVASIIEYGAKAENIKIGRAMIDALTEWVLRKQLLGKPGKGKTKEDQRAEARSVAWAVAMNMKKKGIFNGGKGLRILEKALKGVEKFFAEELKREIKRM